MKITVSAFLLSFAITSLAAPPTELICQKEVNEVLSKMKRPPLQSQKYKFTRDDDLATVYGYSGLLESFEKSKQSLPTKKREFMEQCGRFGFVATKDRKDKRPPTVVIADIMKDAQVPTVDDTPKAPAKDPLELELMDWRQASSNCFSRHIDPCKRDLEKFLSDGIKRIEAKMTNKGLKIPPNYAPGDNGGLLNADKYAGEFLRVRAECARTKLDIERIENGTITFEACPANGQNTKCSEGKEELENARQAQYQLEIEVQLLQQLVPKENAKLYEYDVKKLREMSAKIKELEKDIQQTVVQFGQAITVENQNYQYHIHVSDNEHDALREIVVDTPSCKVVLREGLDCNKLKGVYAFGACPDDKKHAQDKVIYTESPATTGK